MKRWLLVLTFLAMFGLADVSQAGCGFFARRRASGRRPVLRIVSAPFRAAKNRQLFRPFANRRARYGSCYVSSGAKNVVTEVPPQEIETDEEFVVLGSHRIPPSQF